MKKTIGIQEVVWLIFLSIIWGSSFTLIKAAVVWMPPLVLVSFRLTIAVFIFLSIFAFIKPPQGHWKTSWRTYGIIGLCGNIIPFSFIGWSEQQMDSALAAIIIGLMPFFTLIFAHFMTHDERFTPRRILGITLGCMGVALLQGFDIQLERGSHWAMMAMITSAASYGFAAAYARRWNEGHPLFLTGFSTIMACFLSLPLAFYFHGHWISHITIIDPEAMMAAVTLGIVNTTLGGLIFFYLLFKGGAVFASSSNYLMPLFGVLFGVIFWDEALGIPSLLALILILFGCAALAPPQHKGKSIP